MWKKNSLIILLIFISFVSLTMAYRASLKQSVKETLNEYTLVITEPIWNFDTDRVFDYLGQMSVKNNYRSIEVVSADGTLLYERQNDTPKGTLTFLERLGLLPDVDFEQELLYRQEVLGKIHISWMDTSAVFAGYGFVVSVLLAVISFLYTGVAKAKQTLEEKVLLIESQYRELKEQKDYIEEVFNVVPEGLVTMDEDRRPLGNNRSFDNIVADWAMITNMPLERVKEQFFRELGEQLRKEEGGRYTMLINSVLVHLEYASAKIHSFQSIDRVISLRDTTRLSVMERQLAQAQKLEAVGRLAAGIAHEINTPTQYVLSNTDFLLEATEDVSKIMRSVQLTFDAAEGDEKLEALAATKQTMEEVDWLYLAEEIPMALEQSKEGLRRISSIVSAMKHFSHPSGDSPQPADINMAIENTVAVTTNEWKYLAEVELRLQEDLPQVPCYLDSLNQVFLSMIVNGVQAIAEKFGSGSEIHGRIVITTAADEQSVSITIEDNGVGMPAVVKERIFDPFYTTKKLNEGTGQGLAIAHDVIVKRHKGEIHVHSELGMGSSFVIKLPRMREKEASKAQAERLQDTNGDLKT